MNIYKCKWCNKKVERESDKKWIKSFCEETSKYCRLVMVENNK